MTTEDLMRAIGTMLIAISPEIHPDARTRIRGRATYMAACMEREGEHETANACRHFADAIDMGPLGIDD